jgi:hypothetical protein
MARPPASINAILSDCARCRGRSFWIVSGKKTAEPSYAVPEEATNYLGGVPLGQQLDIGGVDANGKDASSEITYMMLQATMNTRLNQPTVGVLWHRVRPLGAVSPNRLQKFARSLMC